MMLTKPLTFENSYESQTTKEQQEVEDSIKAIYEDILESHHHFNNHFEVENHHQFIHHSLIDPLPSGFKSLDANHSWMLYWLINGQILLNQEPLTDEEKSLVVDKITSLVVRKGKGGISGGRNQLGHLASTYAAILALVDLEQYDLLKEIRFNLYDWMMSLKQPDGSFIMHYNGEADARSNYCALVVASLLNILNDEFCEGTLNWINNCQTYEGGFAGVPGTEAHGGYTFCAVASYFLLLGNKSNFAESFKTNMNFDNLLRWLTSRQLQIEGGLSGRTNKLVDSCYSFWVGGVFSMVESVIGTSILDKDALKIYLLNCAQNPKGGFKDKPTTRFDFYHTNYSLLGLSGAEHTISLGTNQLQTADKYAYDFEFNEIDDDTNILPVNPIFGLPAGLAEKCKTFFVAMTA